MDTTPGIQLFNGGGRGNRIENSILNIHQFNNAASSHARETVRERLAAAASPRAFYDAGQVFDAPKCHPGTRTAVLENLMSWIKGDGRDVEGERYALWMHGPAGTGKTAIAHTIAELCRRGGWLLATFFFFRADPTRNNAKSLIPTLAYQAISTLPPFKDFIGHTLDTHPLILDRSIGEQLETLLMEPVDLLGQSGWLSKSHPYVVIIDALDECDSRDMQREILAVLARALNKPGRQHYVRFLIISRPEFEIEREFKSGAVSGLSFPLSLGSSFASEDIRLFLQDKFEEIKRNHPRRESIPDGWPGRALIERLVWRSSGQFIYASTVAKYVDEARRSPSHSLDVVLGLQPSKNNPFAEIDELYTHIISSTDDRSLVLRILAVLLLCHIFYVNDIQEALDLGQAADVVDALADLPSLVEVTSSGHHRYIKIHHASLRDFLVDKERSKELCIDHAQSHTELVCRHLLRRNKDGQYLKCLHTHLQHANQTPNLHNALLCLTVDVIGSYKDCGKVVTALMCFHTMRVTLYIRGFPVQIQHHVTGVYAEILHQAFEICNRDPYSAATSYTIWLIHTLMKLLPHSERSEEILRMIVDTIFRRDGIFSPTEMSRVKDWVISEYQERFIDGPGFEIQE